MHFLYELLMSLIENVPFIALISISQTGFLSCFYDTHHLRMGSYNNQSVLEMVRSCLKKIIIIIIKKITMFENNNEYIWYARSSIT